METLVKAVKNGLGSDERLMGLEMELKQIQQQYNSLIELKSFNKDALVQEPNENISEEEKKTVLLNLINS